MTKMELPKSLQHLAKKTARALLHKVGGLHDIRYWNREACRILMYHDFPASEPGLCESLSRQCAHIAKHYRVVSLDEIDQCLREGKRFPPNALAVTVDDGNRDFLLYGFPIFRKYKIPVTVFLVSGFLDQRLWLWWDQIAYVVEASAKKSVEISLAPGQPSQPFPIETSEQRRQAITILTQALKHLHPEEFLKVLNNYLSKIFEVDLPAIPPQHHAPLTWSEVRELTDEGIEFGAHTVTHPVLSSITHPLELIHEIGDSKRRIEEESRRPVPHFCYPYGSWKDFNKDTIQAVKECGFNTAVVSEAGLNYRGADPYTLRRIPVETNFPDYYFQEVITGMHVPDDPGPY